MPDQPVDVNDAMDQAGELNRSSERDYSENKYADYAWSKSEMTNAAAVLAHDEVYNNNGLRHHRKEKKLLQYAASREEEHTILRILRQQRDIAVEEAKLDENWPHNSAPRTETDDELRSRMKRMRIVPPVIALAVVGIVSVVYFSSRSDGSADDKYFATVGVGSRSAHVSEVSYVDTSDKTVTATVRDDAESSGTVMDRVEIGSLNGKRFVEVTGQGPLSCKIDDDSNNTMVENTADDHVSCVIGES